MSQCLFPRTLKVRNPNFDNRSTNNLVGIRSLSERLSTPYFTHEIQVPCGHCINCLKRRQNDFALRIYLEADKKGSMSFVTLTYNNDTYPISCSLQVLDKDTGEVRYTMPFEICRSKDKSFPKAKSDIIRFHLNAMRVGRTARYYYSVTPFEGFHDDHIRLRYVYTPTLSARDVQLWLKRGRVRYERLYGTKLPQFSYAVCGEYGPNTCRPHYHVVFIGLPKHAVEWLCYDWQQTFGFTYVEHVKRVNDDKSNGFLKAARYVGKYISKGVFECDSKSCGATVPMRLMTSSHLGELPESLINYFRCYDIVGKYDLNDYVPDDVLTRLAVEVPKRSTINLGDFIYSLPSSVKKQIWYVKSSCGSLVSSVVRRSIIGLIRINASSSLAEEIRARCPDKSLGEISLMVCKTENNRSVSNQLENENGMSLLGAFYQKSIF